MALVKIQREDLLALLKLASEALDVMHCEYGGSATEEERKLILGLHQYLGITVPRGLQVALDRQRCTTSAST